MGKELVKTPKIALVCEMPSICSEARTAGILARFER